MVDAALVLERIFIRVLVEPEIDRFVRLVVPKEPHLVLPRPAAGPHPVIKPDIHKRSPVVLAFHDE